MRTALRSRRFWRVDANGGDHSPTSVDLPTPSDLPIRRQIPLESLLAEVS
jgi:hypothetical protein